MSHDSEHFSEVGTSGVGVAITEYDADARRAPVVRGRLTWMNSSSTFLTVGQCGVEPESFLEPLTDRLFRARPLANDITELSNPVPHCVAGFDVFRADPDGTPRCEWTPLRRIPWTRW